MVYFSGLRYPLTQPMMRMNREDKLSVEPSSFVVVPTGVNLTNQYGNVDNDCVCI